MINYLINLVLYECVDLGHFLFTVIMKYCLLYAHAALPQSCISNFFHFTQPQVKVENNVKKLLNNFTQLSELDESLPRLKILQIAEFVKQGLCHLSQSYEVYQVY